MYNDLIFRWLWNLFDDGASTLMQGSSQQIGARCQDSITDKSQKMRAFFTTTGRGLPRSFGLMLSAA